MRIQHATKTWDRLHKFFWDLKIKGAYKGDHENSKSDALEVPSVKRQRIEKLLFPDT